MRCSATTTAAVLYAACQCDFVPDLQIAHVRYLRAALTAAGATPVRFGYIADIQEHVICLRSSTILFDVQVACPSLTLSPAIFTAAATGLSAMWPLFGVYRRDL